MRAPLPVLCALLGFASLASAQPRSVEIFGLGGFSRIVEDEGSLGTGPAVAFAVQAPLTRRLAADLDVAWASASRSIAGVPDFKTRQIQVNPSLVYRWGSEKAYAFAGGGVGFESSEIDDRFRSQGATLNAKGGVVARIRGGLLFRVDIVTAWRFVLPHVQARAGIGYRF